MKLLTHCDTESECEMTVQTTCERFSYGQAVMQISSAFNGSTWFVAYIFFSFVGLLWLAYVFWAYKEFKVHPMGIFFYLTIFEASQGMIAIVSSYICQFKLPQLMCWTVFLQPATYFNQNQATNLITQMFTLIDSFSFSMTLCLNVCLSADLVLMIKYPFKQKEGRVKWYMLYSVTFSLAIAILSLMNVSRVSEKMWMENLLNSALLLAFIVFIFSAFYSVIFAYRKLSAPGISGQVRSLIMTRHFLSLLTFFVCNLYVMSCFTWLFITKFSGEENCNQFFAVLKLLYFGQGYAYFAIRFTEPAIAQILKNQIQAIINFITCKKDQVTTENKKNLDQQLMDEELRNRSRDSNAKKEIKVAPLYLFLASSFNTELVYLILKGICQFSYLSCNTNGQCQFSNAKAAKMTLKKMDGNLTITLKHIKIKNFEQWSELKTEDLQESASMIFSKKIDSHINEVKKSVAVDSEFDSKKDVLILNQTVKITYHRIDLFKEMFAEFFCSQLTNFHQSLHPKHNRDMIFKAGEGAGRSGSFFFFSHDHKFIVKTMTDSELKLFLNRLPAFVEHFTTNKNSLLAKIMGVFTVHTPNLQVHIMLMENTLQLKDPNALKSIFDLKGSLVDRCVEGKIKPSTTMKDQNFLAIRDLHIKSGVPLVNLKLWDQRKLQVAVRKDVEFLRDQGLMDYSLLIAIEQGTQVISPTQVNFDYFQVREPSPSLSNNEKTKNFEAFSKLFTKKHQFTNQNQVYHLAIIDYLQEWNCNKKGERCLKVYGRCKNGPTLSAIEPVEYARRFRHFMEVNVFES